MDVKLESANEQRTAGDGQEVERRLPLTKERQIARFALLSVLDSLFSSFRSTSASGYSLVESLVAMSLFLSVLIPLIGIAGNVLIVSDSTEIGRALAVAQLAILDEESAVESREGFEIERTEGLASDYRAVTVKVHKNGKQLVVLHRLVKR